MSCEFLVYTDVEGGLENALEKAMYTSPIRSSAIVVSTGAKSKSFISGILRGFNLLFMDC